uniref:uncharacterized protein LOC120959143 isoform X1 n=1 Tax=Anopheles coluzzii TaxID=1518534 RepID=UPI0020FFC416|nr:uncharacterized protein LOC120959143 isoform X1 [Anopheles coluzzii]XP_049466170.1 uncharacterized protein LOC120959143 isoform X1 [Anopheles coluzzii]
MMARSGAGPGSTMQLLLVRLLLMGLVLLVVLNGEMVSAGSVRATARQTTATVAEDEDSSSSAAVGGSSAEMLEESEESFEQDASSSGENPSPSRHESAESTTERGGAPDEDDDAGSVTGTTLGYGAVATTPKIVVRPVKQLSRYEQGLEDYDEAADRAEREQQQQQQQEQSVDQQYNNMVKPMLTLFNVISTVLSSGRSMRTVTEGWQRPAADTERTLATTDDGNPGNKTEIITDGEKSTSGTAGGGNENATAEGRYIKGDPLNGYYDFIISEGSYKFWAVFQLVTAAVVIYSTLTAIYYSKVAPLTADYDYIDYLNGGRSFAGARPLDETGSRSAQTSGRRASGWMDNLSSSSWFGPAAQGFTIVMEAIERQQKW